MLIITSGACDVGTGLSSPVVLDYCDRPPYKFNGGIEQAQVKYIKN